jgi:hypothetical protein
MTLRTCSSEREILQALKAGHWPDGCAPELRAHVESCASCRDLVLVTQSFQIARSESVQQAPAGSPGLIWWRAQLRHRYAAARQVSRPISIAQTFALVVTLLVAATFVATQYNHGVHWASWWSGLAPTRLLHLVSSSSVKPDWNLLFLLPGLGVLALFGGVVLYLARKES